MDSSRVMNVERSSLCNCVVNFLLEEGYMLTAFELLHELIEDGRDDQAIRLREYFSDPSLFPSDQIARFNSIRAADPQTLLEEKLVVEEKLAVTEYELRLAHEDVTRLKSELENINEALPDESPDASIANGPKNQREKESNFSSLGPLKDAERKDLNCAVKEYLLFAGYRLTAMTFIEEVTDQNLDVWPKSSACVTDALRRYYYQYLSSTTEAAEEKISLLQENESLMKETVRLKMERDSLVKNKELVDGQLASLSKYLEAAQKDLKERDLLVQVLKQSLELQRKELNECRAEITSLKMHIEGSRASRGWHSAEIEEIKSPCIEKKEETTFHHMETESTKVIKVLTDSSKHMASHGEDTQPEEKVLEMNEAGMMSNSLPGSHVEIIGDVIVGHECDKSKQNTVISDGSGVSCNGNDDEKKEKYIGQIVESKAPEVNCLIQKTDSPRRVTTTEQMAFETIQIVSDALPKIVPYVLINHREELLPLIMCAIERHPDGKVRDSLTHTLFNLIKRPDEQQRRIIMDACVSLAKNVGQMRTETELLPQCWEQINHLYEERRLLVAQSCGELAEFVRPEIRDSLILSIVHQLVEDSAIVVREAAAHNLAMLLPLFPNMDKYFKVEELLFQLVCDPSGAVVDATLKELLPAVIRWGGKMDHVLRVLLAHMLGAAKRCSPISGVEGSVDSHLRVLGEHERWCIDVLLRMMMELLPFIFQRCIDTCPIAFATESISRSEQNDSFFSSSLLQSYAKSNVQWPAFDWIYIDCFPDLIELSCFLPQKEDNLRTRITKILLTVSKLFGDEYLSVIMLPVFLISVGDHESAILTYFPASFLPRVKGLQPRNALAKKIATTCVLPLLLSGILGAFSNHERLLDYLRKLLLLNTTKEGAWSANCSAEVIDAIRFACTFQEHHGTVFQIVWELVACSDESLKTSAANLLKVLVPYTDVKLASTHVLPALVTLGSDQNLNVRYTSIDAFGVVAQHFKNDVIVDKIRIQMDAFLEDGSHEAIISVVRALITAVPHTTDKLREYILGLIFQLTCMPSHGNDVVRRRDRTNAFCEAIRALDATDLSSTSVRDFLIPAIHNLLKDHDNLDPAHKEALEIIMKERSGGAFESISKVMGAHLGIASSMTSFFGETALRVKKESTDINDPSSPRQASSQSQQDDTRFRRIMRGGFGEMLRGKPRGTDDSPN
ncbi:hypothetical protein MA16_Dca007715 [Dendrobium catenatum]|uniref:LisH domain-containing protein n=1 Tax=Dendrobium catenatum TaxID=906689 RepID=A0A2I0X544_9ASPA|nr:hypothetical protein MA16_Dca007715 [Dendrobium catenatum]